MSDIDKHLTFVFPHMCGQITFLTKSLVSVETEKVSLLCASSCVQPEHSWTQSLCNNVDTDMGRVRYARWVFSHDYTTDSLDKIFCYIPHTWNDIYFLTSSLLCVSSYEQPNWISSQRFCYIDTGEVSFLCVFSCDTQDYLSEQIVFEIGRASCRERV